MGDRFKIPSALNTVLVLGIVTGNISILLLATHYRERPLIVLGCAILFSYLMLTNYALIHEAVHKKLHRNPQLNYLLGVCVAALFPLPFSLTATTHYSHHERNRTDTEMFDLYYQDDNLWLKRAQWYSIMTGLFWVGSALGSMIFALFPFVVKMAPFSTARTSAHLARDLDVVKTRHIQIEALIITSIFVVAFYTGTLHWEPTLILYCTFGFNWSTRIYISHAFTSRHLIEGTDNLKHNRLMTLILLHGEWDLNHHRHPHVPWIYLPRLDTQGRQRVPYMRKYLSLWRGPRLTLPDVK